MPENVCVCSARQGWPTTQQGPVGLVVAVSGGPDSVALFRALLLARPSPGIPLIVAHLNHQLRGPASDADEAFVRDLADGHAGVRLAIEQCDIADMVRSERGNLEAIARRERYRWLSSVAQEHGLRFVATGHTADDQAETVLQRLLRGAGPDGLRGIHPRVSIAPDVEVIRPLLSVTRAEVLAFLHECQQPWCQDASNDDRRFLRNRLRHDLLPQLAREYNPRIVEVLGRLAQQASEIACEEEADARTLLAQAELPRAGDAIILDAAMLRAARVRVLRALFRLVWRREGWPMAAMGFAEYDRLAHLTHADTGAADLPGGVHARRQGRVLRLTRREQRRRHDAAV